MLFSFFRKKPKTTALDVVIHAIFGSDRKKTADIKAAARLAFADLLMGQISLEEVQLRTQQNFDSPLPYSTHDLALSVAQHFLSKPENKSKFREVQLVARMTLSLIHI